jgi:mRNA interferase MazF
VVLLEQIRTQIRSGCAKKWQVDDKLMHQVDSAIAVSFGLHPEQLI